MTPTERAAIIATIFTIGCAAAMTSLQAKKHECDGHLMQLAEPNTESGKQDAVEYEKCLEELKGMIP